MSEAKQIYRFERRLLLVCSLLSFLFYFSFFAAEFVSSKRSAEEHPQISFAVHDPVPRVPAGLHLLTFFIFLSLIKPGRFRVASGLLLAYALFLLLSFYIRVDGKSFLGGPIPGDPGFLEELYLKTWIWDYLGVFMLLIMLPWHLSILTRLNRWRLFPRILP